jgi:hypothetical protein
MLLPTDDSQGSTLFFLGGGVHVCQKKPLHYAKRSLRNKRSLRKLEKRPILPPKKRKEAYPTPKKKQTGLSYPSAVSGEKGTVKLVIGKYYNP